MNKSHIILFIRVHHDGTGDRNHDAILLDPVEVLRCPQDTAARRPRSLSLTPLAPSRGTPRRQGVVRETAPTWHHQRAAAGASYCRTQKLGQQFRQARWLHASADRKHEGLGGAHVGSPQLTSCLGPACWGEGCMVGQASLEK